MTITQQPNEAVPAINAVQPEASVAEVPQAQPVAAPQPVAPAKDRTTEQFEKLLDSNKQLFEANNALRNELQQRREAVQQFNPVQLPPIQQQAIQANVNPADFIEINQETGERFVDTEKLQARINDLNNRASRAEEAVKMYVQTGEQREIERQNREAFSAYPELNPSDSSHSPIFHNQTRAVIYDSVLNPQDYGGKPLSFKDAADYVKKQQTQMAEAAQKINTEQVTQQQQAATELKQQATASPASETPAERNAPATNEEIARLRMATRLGSDEALAIRLANVEHVTKEKPTTS